MGTPTRRLFGGAACLTALLLACLCLPSLARAGDPYPADLSFRDGFEGVERFAADVGGESFRAPDSPVFEPGAALTLEGWVYVGGEVPAGNVGAFLIGVAFGGLGAWRLAAHTYYEEGFQRGLRDGERWSRMREGR